MSYFPKPTVLFDPSNMSAFGTLETSELTPVIQGDFTNGINTQLGVTSIVTTGVAEGGGYGSDPNGRLRLQSGTALDGSAVFRSRQPARYRAGQGMVARFTAAFTAGVADSTQIVGVGDGSDGYFFGFNGASFGILHRNSSVGGTAAQWIPQASWNGDKLDGTGASGMTINPTFGNVFMIKYPFLGYGSIQFFVADQITGRMVAVHTIQYPNTTAVLQLANPNLFFYAQSVNTGAAAAPRTNMLTYVGSYAIFLSGPRSFVSNPKWGFDNNKIGIVAETSIFGLQNAASYNGHENHALIRLNSISCAGQSGAAIVTVRLKIDATVAGVPSYAAISGSIAGNGATITSGNSVASVDTAGTAITASTGILIYNLVLGHGANSGSSHVIDLTEFNLTIAPGQILSVTGASTASAQIGVALNWTEDV